MSRRDYIRDYDGDEGPGDGICYSWNDVANSHFECPANIEHLCLDIKKSLFFALKQPAIEKWLSKSICIDDIHKIEKIVDKVLFHDFLEAHELFSELDSSKRELVPDFIHKLFMTNAELISDWTD